MEEQAKYADSIQGRVNSLAAMWQEFSNTFLDSNLVKGFVSVLTEVLKVVENIIDTIGGVGTAGLIGALFMGAKGISGLSGIKNMFSDLKTIGSLVISGKKSFGELQAAGSRAGKAIGSAFSSTGMAITAGIGAAIAVIGTAIQIYDNWRREIEETRQANIDLSNGFDDALGGFERVYIKYADKTLLTTEEENELVSAIDGTITALGNKSGALREAAGASSEYIANLDKIAKAELKQSKSLSQQALSDARARLNDKFLGDNPGQLSLGNLFGAALGETTLLQKIRGLFTGVTFSKMSNADFALGKKSDKAYQAIEGYIQKGKELGYVMDDLNPELMSFSKLFSNDEGFVFDNFDESFDGYIKQVDYIQGIVDRLNDKASETGDNSYLDSDLYKNAKESLDMLLPYMEEYTTQTYNAEKAQYQLKNGIAKNVDEFNKMRESVLKSSSDSIAGRVAVGDLMNNEYQNMFDLSSIESQMDYIKSVTDGIVKLNSIDMGKFETVLDLKTTVNNGEGTVGDYIGALESANDAISKIKDEDAQEFLRIQLGLKLDSNGKIDDDIKHMRDKLINSMKKSDIDKDVAEAFTDSLTATQLKAVIDGDIEIDWKNFDPDKVRKQIEDQVNINEAIAFTVDIELETENLDKLKNAVAKSISGTGLDTESFENVERIFAGLSNYDPAKLFERTANGIRLNTDELRKMNDEYANENINGLHEKMSVLGDEYNRTKSELANLTYGTEEYNAKANELGAIEKQINDCEKLTAQYEGLTSAYNEWQMAESAGNQRDMYESVINGFKTVEDELSRGWVDEGTIQFVEMLSGKDLTSGNVDEIRSAWEGLGKTIEHTTYSAKDFFTVNEEGQSTSDGVYNFLDAVGQLEEEVFGGKDVVQRDGNGNIIGFDFQLVGGDEAIAEALGVSEELVQIMVRAADDAGFVVSMDGTFQQLDVLKEKAAEAALSLKETFKITDHSFFQDGSADGILNDYNEAIKIWDSFKQNKNADGTINMNVEGAEEAFTLISTLQTMVDQLNEPAYMSINTSDVEKDMQQPLSQLQQYERLTQTEHQLKLKGTDTSQIEASKEEVLDYFEGLEPEVKAQLGIDELSREQLQEQIEAGEIEVPATVDLQVEMNDTLKDMVNVALYNAGVINDKELESRVDVSVYANDVDASDVKEKTDKAVSDASKDKKKTESTTDVDVKAGKVDASDVKDKTEKAVSDVSGLSKSNDLTKSIRLDASVSDGIDGVRAFAEAAKTLEGVDNDINKKITANIDSNLGGFLGTGFNGALNNLQLFAEGAKALDGVKSSNVKVTANIESNLSGFFGTGFNGALNNLQTFADGAKALQGVGSVNASVNANLYSNLSGFLGTGFNGALNNLQIFADGAKALRGIGDVDTSVNANLYSNLSGFFGTGFNGALNNLQTFADGAKSLMGVGDVDASVNANIYSNLDGLFGTGYNGALNNLTKFAEGANALKDVGEVKASVDANIHSNLSGALGTGYNGALNNLQSFADGAKALKGVGEDVSVDVHANIYSNLSGALGTGFNGALNNLTSFAEGAKALKGVGEDVSVDVNANIYSNLSGALGTGFNGALNNLTSFAEGAKALKGIGDVKTSVTADIYSNLSGALGTGFNGALNNLKPFAEGANALKGVGDVKTSVTANIYSNLDGFLGTGYNGALNNLKPFAEGAAALKSVGGDVVANVTANLYGNLGDLTNTWANDRLSGFASAATALKDVGSPTSTVTANANVNVSDDDISKISSFADSATKLAGTPSPNVNVSVSADTAAISNVQTTLQNLSNSGVMKDYTANVTATAKITPVPTTKNMGDGFTGSGKVTMTPEDWSLGNGFKGTGLVDMSASTKNMGGDFYGSGTVTLKANVTGLPSNVTASVHKANGTAHVNGTAFADGSNHKKFKSGNWGTEDSGTALMGELGQETIVRDGHFFTVGDNGAEFVKYRKGDIIFNHKQTEELFKNGYVTSGGGRGRAYVDGTAFARGSSGSGGWGRPGSGSTVINNYNYNVSSGSSKSTKSSKSSSSSSSKASEEAEKFEEVLDWVEVAIDRIERAIKNLDTVASSTFRSWSERTSALNEQIAQTRNEIDLQQRAYDRYMKAANDVGLDAGWVNKIQNGKVDIELITDENLKDKIDQYQQW